MSNGKLKDAQAALILDIMEGVWVTFSAHSTKHSSLLDMRDGEGLTHADHFL